MAAKWDFETVDFREIDGLSVSEERRRFSRFLVPDVGDSLKEQERKDVGLPVRPVYGAAAEDLGAFPQM
jgi:hypothetical protein